MCIYIYANTGTEGGARARARETERETDRQTGTDRGRRGERIAVSMLIVVVVRNTNRQKPVSGLILI